jgi:hypothetical protein
MSLSDTKAWATREYETASHSRAILSLVNGDNKKSLRRVYLFDYPIYHLASRMDRERQLFNATMAEHIQHEQRRSPWLRRTLLSILFAVIFWVLYAFPPPIVAESALYRLLGMWRREAVGVGTFALAGYKVHVKVPEKVWVDATDSMKQFFKWGRGLVVPELSPVLWRANLARQVQVLRERPNVGAGAMMSPGEAVVLVVRGEVRTANYILLRPKDVIRIGAPITTGPRAMVKFWLEDGSTFTVGPDSSIRLVPVESGEPTEISLLAGSLRARVTKSIVRGANGKPKDKLYIRTASAALGIRGTDFYVTYTPGNESTSLVTFEGLVGFARLLGGDMTPARALEEPTTHNVGEGFFSEVRAAPPTPPGLLSAAQLQALKTTSDVAGPKEIETQEQTLRFLEAVQRAGALVRTENPRAGDYESLSDEAFEAVAAPLAPKMRPAPRAEDYENSRAPASLSKDKAEFPDEH